MKTPESKKARVLIVDDEAAVRSALEKLLKSHERRTFDVP